MEKGSKVRVLKWEGRREAGRQTAREGRSERGEEMRWRKVSIREQGKGIEVGRNKGGKEGRGEEGRREGQSQRGKETSGRKGRSEQGKGN